MQSKLVRDKPKSSVKHTGKKPKQPSALPRTLPKSIPVSRPKASVIGPSQQAVARNPRTGLTRGPRGTGLSEAAMVYAKALSNPFGEFEDLPCTPSSPPAETYRFRSVYRATFSTGTAGVGFVSINPCVAANDATFMITSAAAFAGTGYAQTPLTGLNPHTDGKLPFAAADFTQTGEDLSFRLVGAGIRIRNISQALNVGGQILATRLPDPVGLLSAFSVAEIYESPYTVVLNSALDKQSEWKTLIWVPTFENQLGLESFWTTGVPMGFLAQVPVTGAPAQQFEVEVIRFFEFAGSSVNGGTVPSTTVSAADAVGLDRVIHGAAYLTPTLSVSENTENMAQGVVEAFAHSDSAAKTVEDLLGLAGMTLVSAGKVAGALVKFLLI